MGLFDAVFGGLEGDKAFSPQEAFAGVLLGATACDGHIADEEIQGLFTILTRMKMFQRFADKHYQQLMDRLIGIFKRHGVETLLRKAADGLPQDLHETAFANACDLVLADGVVEETEKEFLDELQRILQIPGDQALTIVQVMIVKNKG